ncbi:MAG: hypothetical protein AAB587_02165 [Patescibacteria group bacterium]
MSPQDLRKLLIVTKEALKAAQKLREKSIEDAIALESGSSPAEKKFHPLWTSDKFEVGVGKPGKEVERKGELANTNDMWPYIKEGGSFKEESATFRSIFRELEHLVRSRRTLELLGSLFVRSAFMLDHEVKEGRITYVPPQKVLEEIRKDVLQVYGVPLEVFLQYVEAIALNEEVKYYTRGKARGKSYGPGAGRQNNLLSCAHLVAVLLGRAGLVDFAYGFAMMRGVSPISIKKAKVCFPMLGADSGSIEEGEKGSQES